MKKKLCFIWEHKHKKAEQGFVLPYVLFIATLMLIIVTASINTYQQGMEVTYQQIDQIKMETLFQMGLAKIKEEHLPSERETLTVNYHFPDGQVTIDSELIDDMGYELYFEIKTINDSVYSTSHTIKKMVEE